MLFLVIIVSLLALACKKVNTSVEKETPKFYGSLTVRSDGKDFTSENLAVQVASDPSGKTMDMKLHKVKFVPAMPVRIDVTIPDITLEADGSFHGDNIVPYALGGRPYPKYTVYGLEGKIKDGTLVFSLKFGNYPTTYSGKL